MKFGSGICTIVQVIFCNVCLRQERRVKVWFFSCFWSWFWAKENFTHGENKSTASKASNQNNVYWGVIFFIKKREINLSDCIFFGGKFKS